MKRRLLHGFKLHAASHCDEYDDDNGEGTTTAIVPAEHTRYLIGPWGHRKGFGFSV